MNSATTTASIYPNIDINKFSNSKVQLNTFVRILRDGVYYLVRMTYEFYSNIEDEVLLSKAVLKFNEYVYQETILHEVSNALDGYGVLVDVVDENQEPEVDRIRKCIANKT